VVNPLRLAAAAWRAVAAEYRRQRHPERGWFYYARIGAGAFRLPPDAAAGDD
jgi:hypothetical protein